MIITATLIPFSFFLVALYLFAINLNSKDPTHGKRLVDEFSQSFSDLLIKQNDRTRVKDRLLELHKLSSGINSNFNSIKSINRDEINFVEKKVDFEYRKFRVNQALTSIGAGLIPIILWITRVLPFTTCIGLLILIPISIYFFMDRQLNGKIQNRRARIESEFPAIVEILTLAISAGETPISAFARIASRSDSQLAISMQNIIKEVKKGLPFHVALDQFSHDANSLVIRRFVDALVIALTRGAPLVDVLQRHVAEARINHRNAVLDKAGRAEVTMMIPIVFLILPISVVFALWPSMSSLSFFAS